MKNASDSEDALQNAFVKIWRHIGTYDSQRGSLFTWMLNIAQHEALDLVRSKYYKQRTVTENLKDDQPIIDGTDPFLHMDYINIHKLLALLKPMDRAIFELVYYRGYSCEQTAAILKMPCGSIKTRLQSGYKKLRSAMVQPVGYTNS